MLDLTNKEIYSQKADIETSSEDYAKRFSGKIGEYFLSVQSEITLKLLKKWQNAKILDVGGGHAQLAIPLIENGFDVTIAGSNESCRERLDKFLSPSTFRFYNCNLLKLPFDNKSFDVVTSIRLLTHENNWKLQISELCRVAKYGVIVDYPDIRSFNILYDLLFGMKKKFEKNTRTYRNFSRKGIIEEFRKNNFGSITIKPELFLPMVVHRAVKNVPLLKSAEKLFSMLGLTKIFGSPVILRAETNTN